YALAMFDLFSYTVAAEFDDPNVAHEWIAWLRNEHLAEVIAGGAMDAQVILLDPQPGTPGSGGARCEVRDHFAHPESFAAYERHHAPALRAKGVARFPVERGVRLLRRSGVVVAHVQAWRPAWTRERAFAAPRRRRIT